MPFEPVRRVPRTLIALDVLGVVLTAAGIVEALGLHRMMPEPLRFGGCGLLLIALGFLLTLPLMRFLIGQGPRELPRPHRLL